MEFNSGGHIPGPNVNKDIVPAMLTPGEFVLRRDAVKSIGLDALYAMNEGKGMFTSLEGMSGGGLVEARPININEQSLTIIPFDKPEATPINFNREQTEDSISKEYYETQNKKISKNLKKTEDAISRIENSIQKLESRADTRDNRSRRISLEKFLQNKQKEREELLKSSQLIEEQLTKAEEQETRRAEEQTSSSESQAISVEAQMKEVDKTSANIAFIEEAQKNIAAELTKNEEEIRNIQTNISNLKDVDSEDARKMQKSLETSLEEKISHREVVLDMQRTLDQELSDETQKQFEKTTEQATIKAADVQKKQQQDMLRQMEILQRNNITEGFFKMGHLVDENNKVVDFDSTKATSIEEAQKQVNQLFDTKSDSITTSAETVVPSQSQEEPSATQPVEKTEEEKKIEISNLKDISESSFIVWQKANEEMMKSIQNGISDEEYKKRQEEVNNLSKQYEQNSKIYQDKLEEYSSKTQTKIEPRSFEEIMDSVYRIQKNTPTGFEAILPPEDVRLDEKMRTPNTNWVTRLAGTSNSSISENSSTMTAIHDIGRTIASSVDERLYQTKENTTNIPRTAEPIMQWNSKNKPITASLFEETFTRIIQKAISESNTQNKPTVVNNNSTVIGGGDGGGGQFPPYNTPRFSPIESETISRMTGEYTKGAVV